jgi:hypothetical protein
MQITDEQFIKAINAAVDAKGCHNRAQGFYKVPGTKSAHCIIGVALDQINSSLVPDNNRLMAHALLRQYGCSERVAQAAIYAQRANDIFLPWGSVLNIFNQALALYDQGVRDSALAEVIDPLILDTINVTYGTAKTITNQALLAMGIEPPHIKTEFSLTA